MIAKGDIYTQVCLQVRLVRERHGQTNDSLATQVLLNRTSSLTPPFTESYEKVISVAVNGWAVKAHQVYGPSDIYLGHSLDRKVTKANLTATSLHCFGLGTDPVFEIQESFNCPIPASRCFYTRGIY